MVVDSGRTLVIWTVSLLVQWQPFHYRPFLLQLVGFIFLISGMMVYNDILFRPLLIQHNCLKPKQQLAVNEPGRPRRDDETDEYEPLLNAA
jgi:hypothetical protein